MIESVSPALLLDLDGTLVDSVCRPVVARPEALERAGIDLCIWKIHRRVGMRGCLFATALVGEIGRELTAVQEESIRRDHDQSFQRLSRDVQPLPAALERLSAEGTPWAIATSGTMATARASLEQLRIPAGVPVITHAQVSFAKPNPDLGLAAAAQLKVSIADAIVVGDSTGDILAARRARALGIGLLSGGYGREELETVGAFRVYDDPADLLRHLYELGIRGGRRP
ncbi:MAG TPA: HAD family hydrolase [Candidatus Nanopelagicaceae bacterium]|nr:HAD family hydrolase [Candidatus Nanopelagicaceae bacterium]